MNLFCNVSGVLRFAIGRRLPQVGPKSLRFGQVDLDLGRISNGMAGVEFSQNKSITKGLVNWRLVNRRILCRSARFRSELCR